MAKLTFTEILSDSGILAELQKFDQHPTHVAMLLTITSCPQCQALIEVIVERYLARQGDDG